MRDKSFHMTHCTLLNFVEEHYRNIRQITHGSAVCQNAIGTAYERCCKPQGFFGCQVLGSKFSSLHRNFSGDFARLYITGVFEKLAILSSQYTFARNKRPA